MVNVVDTFIVSSSSLLLPLPVPIPDEKDLRKTFCGTTKNCEDKNLT